MTNNPVVRNDDGRLSKIPICIWEGIQRELQEGHTIREIRMNCQPYDIAAHMIYYMNRTRWHINIRSGRSPKNGLFCADCQTKDQNYRRGLCRKCWNTKYNTGLPHGFKTGAAHPNWKGGKTKNDVRFSPEYKAWRKAVYDRDNYTCQHCGAHGVRLQAHHKKPQSLFPELRYVLGNGLTLCLPCHKATSSYLNNKMMAVSFLQDPNVASLIDADILVEETAYASQGA